MNYTEILHDILKSSNDLINSPEYRIAYSDNKKFIRNRKLSFANSIYLILSGLRKSLSIEISNFADKYSDLNFQGVSKQAFSKARQHILPEAFSELCRLIVKIFYGSGMNTNQWNGFNVFAIDGTSLQIPDTLENVEVFGCKKNQYNIKTALASASMLYDVLNDIVVDAIIDTYPAKEKIQARNHIETITTLNQLQNSIITFDRGYPSFEFFNYLSEKGIFYVFRLSEAFNFAKSEVSEDTIHTYKKGKITGNLRIIKIILPDGTKETLATNLFDATISVNMFKELYFLRWGIEVKYKELKSNIEIEEFSGKKPITIKQDFYASIYLSMIASLLKKQSDELIRASLPSNAKYQYQSNRKFILNKVFRHGIEILVYPRKRKILIQKIIKNAQKIRSQIRPNRSCERQNRHPRKKHHYQSKACI